MSTTRRIHRLIRPASVAVVVGVLLAATPLGAQEDVASAIIESPVATFQLAVSQRVDFAELDPGLEGDLADAWVKSFTDGIDSISIIATQFRNTDDLRAGLAGSMARIPLADRTAHPEHDGVVYGPVVLDGVAGLLAIYGEGTMAFTIVVVAGDEQAILDEALAVQLPHSQGDRFPLRVDENERFLTDSDGDGALQIGRILLFVVPILVIGIGIWAIRSRRQNG